MAKTSVSNPYDPRKILAHPLRLKKILDGGKISHPVTLEVDLVDGICNSRCVHCCFEKYGSKPIYLKTAPLYASLEQAARKGVLAVELVGGTEPLMHPAVADVVKTIKSLGMEVGLITNGVLLEKVFPVASMFTFIRVSLDAGTKNTYQKVHGVSCFQKVTDNIQQLARYHLDPSRIGLGYLCVPNNCSEIEIMSAVRMGVKDKLGYIVFRPAILPASWKPDYLDSIGDIIHSAEREHGKQIKIYSSVTDRWQLARTQKRLESGLCFTNGLTGIIMANGNVPFCNLYRRRTDLTLGNIYRRTFSEIWESEDNLTLRNTVNISTCPIPCKADDYRRVLFENKSKLNDPRDNFDFPGILPCAHACFI